MDNYQLLFDAVGRLPTDHPHPWLQELNAFTMRMLVTFGRKSPLTTSFAIQSGSQLSRSCQPFVSELSLHVGLSVVDPWRTQWEEVTRVFRRFFSEAGDNPAVFWGHTVCWTDRAIRRQFLGCDLQAVDQQCRPLPSDRRLKLRFHGDRKASFDAWKFRWLQDGGIEVGGERLHAPL